MRRVACAAVGVVGWLVACGNDYSSVDGTHADGDGGLTPEAGSGSPEAAAPPPGCDENADARDAVPCIDDRFVVFVNPANGNDQAPGTKAAPFETIGAASTRATADGKSRVYICGASPTTESVELGKTATLARLAGGFDCTTWLPSPDVSTKIAATDASRPALSIVNTAPLRIEDLTIVGPDGTPDHPSSVAVLVAESNHVAFVRTQIQAGKGAAGKDGVAGVSGVRTPANGNGNPTFGSLSPGASKTCTCSTSTTSTVGGMGGYAVMGQADGANGMPTLGPSTGQGQTSAVCKTSSGVGGTGGDGPGGTSAPAPPVGTADDQGWHPGTAKSGDSGGVGQGGGGGGGIPGSASVSGAGGGGGCGGCPGSGGESGGGGGGSIGLLVLGTKVDLAASKVTASTGGTGGVGAAGAAGQAGGGGGALGGHGCAGGSGGAGGRGGDGSGGAGGVSVAVFYTGEIPSYDPATTFTHDAAGARGEGPTPGPAGIAGVVIEVP